MNTTIKYSVQLITEAEQLTEALSLRYRTFKKVYPKLTEQLTQPYESDAFDSRSIHMGLYCENGIEKKLAGYCRLILPEYFESKFSDLLIKKHSHFLSKAQNTTTEKLMVIERLPEEYRKMINSFCNSLETKEIIYAETSRFIIDEEHRSVSLSSFFISSMFVIGDSLNIGYSFFICNPHHIGFYKKLGLTLFPVTGVFYDSIFGAEQVIFGTDISFIKAQQTSINTLKLQFEEENRITFRRAA